MNNQKYISVFIPVYNGEIYLRDTIASILSQDIPSGYDLELMVTDSGSKDKSVEIAKSFGDKIIFNEIPNTEYGHGKTRQQAVERARGEYVLFITQDATPVDNRWIINMLDPFFVSDKVGCVFGRQVPRPYAVPTIKREVSGVFNSFGAANSVVLHSKSTLIDNANYQDYNYFFSDVNSAVRKDLNATIPFRDVKYAEDMALAEDIMNAGYIKAYSPRGAVWHSNEYTAREYYHRKFDEFLGLIRNGDIEITMSLKEQLLGWIKPSIADWKFIKHDREYNKRAKLKYMFISPIYNINEKRGKFDAIKHHSNAAEIEKRSLEQRNKS